MAILAVGTELLTGEIVNGNAAWLGEQFTAAGLRVVWSAAVGDDLDVIVAALRHAAERSSTVVVTGGLGPTHDDLTRDALAVAAGVPLVRDPAIEQALVERLSQGRAAGSDKSFPVANLRQADVPVGATALANPLGTAPGLRIALGSAVVYAAPGVPVEMKEMTRTLIVPDVLARAGDLAMASTQLKIAGLAESVAAELIEPVLAGAPDVEVAILSSLGLLRLRASVRGDDQAVVEARVADVIGQLRAALGVAVYGEDADTLPGVVLAALAARNASIAVAESLTGGLLGAELSAVPGASAAFRGGIIAYNVEAKARLLGVPDALLAERGPVDEDVVAAMAEGARSLLHATYGVALTGVAGPEAHGGQPPGTVWCAVAGPDGTSTVRWEWKGNRDRVRTLAATYALDFVRRELIETPPDRGAADGNITGKA